VIHHDSVIARAVVMRTRAGDGSRALHPWFQGLALADPVELVPDAEVHVDTLCFPVDEADARQPRPPFQVLIISEESRLGREAIETAYA
jgi:hypothetical protein